VLELHARSLPLRAIEPRLQGDVPARDRDGTNARFRRAASAIVEYKRSRPLRNHDPSRRAEVGGFAAAAEGSRRRP
jgi:hypothetical protein